MPNRQAPEPKFGLGEDVTIRVSGEGGQVVGFAVYEYSSEPSYLVRYKAGDGRAVEAWWTESALSEIAPA